jgi:hypothetical protein
MRIIKKRENYNRGDIKMCEKFITLKSEIRDLYLEIADNFEKPSILFAEYFENDYNKNSFDLLEESMRLLEKIYAIAYKKDIRDDHDLL